MAELIGITANGRLYFVSIQLDMLATAHL